MLRGGVWLIPSAVSLLKLPNFDDECPRPCSLGMTRSQKQEDSERRMMNGIPLSK